MKWLPSMKRISALALFAAVSASASAQSSMTLFDSLFPRGRRYYWKAQFLHEIADSAIEALLDTYARAPNKSSLLILQHVGGAIAHVPISDTAYAHRAASFDCFPIAIWDDADLQLLVCSQRVASHSWGHLTHFPGPSSTRHLQP